MDIFRPRPISNGMKYSVRQYALALSSALKAKKTADAKKIIHNFLRILSRNGDQNKIDLITKEVERQERVKKNIYKVELASSTKISSHLKEEIEKILGKKIDFTEKIDTDIYAGLKILVEDELLIDATAKSQIAKIFQ